MKEFDAIIIGAGQAGPALAGRLTGGGMTEGQARESGRPLLVGSRPMSRVSRAAEKG